MTAEEKKKVIEALENGEYYTQDFLCKHRERYGETYPRYNEERVVLENELEAIKEALEIVKGL